MKHRITMLVPALLAVAMFAIFGARAASAQETDTCCVRISNSTTCHITICVTLPDGTQRCELVPQLTRTRFEFPCDSTMEFSATGACGVPTRLLPDQCVRMLLRGTLCCAEVCLRRGEDGCYEITITDTGYQCTCD